MSFAVASRRAASGLRIGAAPRRAMAFGRVAQLTTASSPRYAPQPTAPAASSTTATQPHPQPPSASYSPPRTSVFTALDTFLPRHLGPRDKDIDEMLKTLGYDSMDAFVDETIPRNVRVKELVDREQEGIRPMSELELRRRAEEIASMNRGVKSYIGMGYHNAIVPPVVQRNVRPSFHGWLCASTD